LSTGLFLAKPTDDPHHHRHDEHRTKNPLGIVIELHGVAGPSNSGICAFIDGGS
jgi:hypothetical protein